MHVNILIAEVIKKYQRPKNNQPTLCYQITIITL